MDSHARHAVPPRAAVRHFWTRWATAMAVTMLALPVSLAATTTAARAGGTGSTSPQQVASSTGVDWPAFRYNAAHLGVTRENLLNSTNASTLVAGWSAATGAGGDGSPAVATNGSGVVTVYVGDLAGVLHAYAASDGTQLWSYSVSGTSPEIFSSPTVFGGTVYFASNLGTLFALNATTGALVCSFNTTDHIQTSPTVVAAPDGSGPLVYIGTSSKAGEWAIYGAGNTHGQCTKDWTFTHFGVSPGGTWSSAAYGTDGSGEHVVVFGSKDDDDSVYALDASTGAELWRYQTSDLKEQDVGGSPLISAPGVNGIADGAAYVEGKDGLLYALDLTKGTLLWSFKVGGARAEHLSPIARREARSSSARTPGCTRSRRRPEHSSGTRSRRCRCRLHRRCRAGPASRSRSSAASRGISTG